MFGSYLKRYLNVSQTLYYKYILRILWKNLKEKLSELEKHGNKDCQLQLGNDSKNKLKLAINFFNESWFYWLASVLSWS